MFGSTFKKDSCCVACYIKRRDSYYVAYIYIYEVFIEPIDVLNLFCQCYKKKLCQCCNEQFWECSNVLMNIGSNKIVQKWIVMKYKVHEMGHIYKFR